MNLHKQLVIFFRQPECIVNCDRAGVTLSLLLDSNGDEGYRQASWSLEDVIKRVNIKKTKTGDTIIIGEISADKLGIQRPSRALVVEQFDVEKLAYDKRRFVQRRSTVRSKCAA